MPGTRAEALEVARVALEFLETAPAIHRADAWRLGREIFSHDSTCESGRSAKLRGRSLWPLVVVARKLL